MRFNHTTALSLLRRIRRGEPVTVDAEQRVEIAVVDAGVGLLSNVGRFDPTICTHQGAIGWCFAKGNTTARTSPDGMEQRLPEDAVMNPFPAGVATRTTANHHVGEGLWQLHQLVMALGNLGQDFARDLPPGL